MMRETSSRSSMSCALRRARCARWSRARAPSSPRVELPAAQQLGPAEDRVERRAQLVREGGQELVLEPVGLLGLGPRRLLAHQRSAPPPAASSAISCSSAAACVGSRRRGSRLVEDAGLGEGDRDRSSASLNSPGSSLSARQSRRDHLPEQRWARRERADRRRGRAGAAAPARPAPAARGAAALPPEQAARIAVDSRRLARVGRQPGAARQVRGQPGAVAVEHPDRGVTGADDVAARRGSDVWSRRAVALRGQPLAEVDELREAPEVGVLELAFCSRSGSACRLTCSVLRNRSTKTATFDRRISGTTGVEDVVHRPERVAPRDVHLVAVIGGEEDDRDVLRLLALPDERGRLEPVHPGMLHVEQDDRERRGRARAAGPRCPDEARTSFRSGVLEHRLQRQQLLRAGRRPSGC